MNAGSAKCTVRPWNPADADSLVVQANNRSIWRNMLDRFPYPYTHDNARAWFALLAGMAEPTHWAIEVDGRAAGGIGVDIGEGVFSHCGQFGYWLGETYWGRGIMTAAVGIALKQIWSRFDLKRLEASVFSWNPASMRVLEKSGFVREGVLRQRACKDGELVDCVMYAALRQTADAPARAERRPLGGKAGSGSL